MSLPKNVYLFCSYWQETLMKTVKALVETYGVEGVYLDQLGAAAPSPDWTPSHNHSLGGGSYWRDGVVAIMKTIREAVSDCILVSL